MTVTSTTDFSNGYTLDQLENERGEVYYRACKDSICRYAEDHYIAMMYLEGMGWNPTEDHQ